MNEISEENQVETMGTPLPTIAKASEVMAQTLQELILSNHFQVSSSLPSERELMANYGVSRATIREALRKLEAHGLVEIRRGRKGGAFVREPSASTVGQSLNLYMRGQKIQLSDLVVARETIEPVAAALAALVCTQEELEQLRSLCDECERSVGTVADFAEVNIRWHLAVIDASHNPIFKAIMSHISSAIHTATDLGIFDLQTRKAVVGLHWSIFNAIRDKDPAAAHRRMARHVGAYGNILAELGIFTLPNSLVSGR